MSPHWIEDTEIQAQEDQDAKMYESWWYMGYMHCESSRNLPLDHSKSALYIPVACILDKTP